MEDCGVEIRDCILFLGTPSYMIALGRLPLEGTVAENVLRYGTGGLNIDVSRVSIEESERLVVDNRSGYNDGERGGIYSNGLGKRPPGERFKSHEGGRWPPNLILSSSPEVLGKFPESKGQQGAVTGKEPSSKTDVAYGEFASRKPFETRGDTGSAARFFYTVTEDNSLLELMRYMCKLCTPPQGKALVVGLDSDAIIGLESLGFNVFQYSSNE
jgi:site-specific DNA-methyltransferase (adenine-specific)